MGLVFFAKQTTRLSIKSCCTSGWYILIIIVLMLDILLLLDFCVAVVTSVTVCSR